MNESEYKEKVDQVTKTLQSWIDHKALTLDSRINLVAISHAIIGDLNGVDQETEKRRKIGEMFETMQAYFPKVASEFLEKMRIV